MYLPELEGVSKQQRYISTHGGCVIWKWNRNFNSSQTNKKKNLEYCFYKA